MNRFGGGQANSGSMHDVDYTRAMPDSLKSDPKMLALGKAIAGELQENIRLARLAIVYPRIDELCDELLDILATDLHVDWYDDALPIGVKRHVIKDSIKVHKRLGTKYILEKTIRALFFASFRIEEWFEYEGRPYYFRLVSNDLLPNPQQLYDLIRAIYELKNERSWLESLIFEGEFRSPIYVGMAGRLTGCFEVGGTMPGPPDVKPLAINMGLAGKRTGSFHVGGEAPEACAAGAVKTGTVGKLASRFEVGARRMESERGIYGDF